MQMLQVKQCFVKGFRNVRNFDVMMDGLEMAKGEGRLACVPGIPGIGKTVTGNKCVSRLGGVYLRVASIWKRSELEFIQALCRELDVATPQARKGRCYAQVIERLIGTDRPVCIDEMQRLPRDFLNIVLDLSDATGCPFILVGEPELKGMMQENKRVWSRTYQLLEFDSLGVSDVLGYASEAIGIVLPTEVATVLHKSSGGDLRTLRRDLIALVQFVNAKGPGPDGQPQITEEMARIAVQVGLKGIQQQQPRKGGQR